MSLKSIEVRRLPATHVTILLSLSFLPAILHAGDASPIPASPSALAFDAYRHGDLIRAEQEFRAALAAPKDFEEVLLRNQLGRVLEDLSRLDDAEKEYRRVVELNKKSSAPLEIETASALNNLGSIEQKREHWQAADDLLNQAYGVLEKRHAASSAIGGYVLTNMGINAQHLGQYEKARVTYARALPLIQNANGDQSEEFARLLKNWALLSFQTARFQDALDKNSEALKIEAALPNVSAADKALTWNNQGLVLATLQRSSEAEAAYSQALQLRLNFSWLRVDQAKTLNNLSMLEKDEGRFEAASQHALAALKVATAAHPQQISTVAAILNNLGLIALAQNKFPQAKASFEKAKALWIATMGTNNPNYGTTLLNLGLVESRQGHHKQAQQLFETALGISEAAFGPVHPQTATGLADLAAEFYRQKRYDDALRAYQRAVQIQEQFFGARSVIVAKLWRNIAATFFASKDLESSEAAFRNAVTSLRAASGPDDAALSTWLEEYANVLRKDRHFGEAERAEVEAVRIHVKNTLQSAKGTTQSIPPHHQTKTDGTGTSGAASDTLTGCGECLNRQSDN